jgi:hypothetical protein
MAEEIINKVAQSALVQIDLEDYYVEGARKSIDLKDWLYEGLILREKDFRESVKNHDWEQYENAFVSIHCSTDAIIPLWASMVLTAALQPFAKRIVFGTQEELEALLYEDAFAQIDFEEYSGKPMIIKGCSNKPVPVQAFVSFTQRAQPYVRSVMFGEACSTVPVFKKKRK